MKISEAFETVYNNIDYLTSDIVIEDDEVNGCVMTIKEQLLTIKQALHRLESIDNSNPSEALECLEKLKGMEISSMPFSDEYGTQEVDLNDIRKVGSQLNTDFREYTTTIKQALLKAQEQEKENKVLKACIRDWEDDYKHLEYALHKAQVRIELKAFKIIKEKLVDVFKLYNCKTVEEYNQSQYRDCMLTEEEFNLLKEVLE